jgi:hypothetical protein
MKSLRNFAYATVLSLTMLTIASSPASADGAMRGTFTLSHDVRWQNAVVPAGDYEFSFGPNELSGMLRLHRLSGGRASFLLMVPRFDEAKPSDAAELVLEITPEGSYASAMQLPQVGMTLRFGIPQMAEKGGAKLVNNTIAAAR